MHKSFATALLILTATSAAAQSPTAGPPQSEEAAIPSGQSIEALARGSYSSRQQATWEMWRSRERLREEVQAAASHSDPEVAGRAKWILRQWRLGSLPGTPPEISRLLVAAKGGEAIERLLVEGQFGAALVALEESAGTLQGETIRQRITDTLRTRFPLVVHAAVESDRVDQLLEFIDAVADSKELAVCRIDLMQVLGVDVESTSLLPPGADAWTAAARDEALVLVLLRLDRPDDALEVARQSGDPELQYRCRAITGRWHEAAEEAVAAARRTENGTLEHARHWSRVMIAADRAVDERLFDEAAEALTAAPHGGERAAAELRWRTLASHGRIDDALAVMSAGDRESAALLALDASRPAAALEALEFPLQHGDHAIFERIDRAITAQVESSSDELAAPILEAFALIRCLIAIGREDTAAAAVERICQSPVTVGALRLRDYCLSTLSATRRSDWVIDHAVDDEETMISSVSRAILARTLPDCDSAAFDVVFEVLQKLNPDQPLRQRVADTCKLFQGEVPRGFDSSEGFRELFELAISPRRPIRGVRGSLVDLHLNMNLMRLFVRHGQSDFAAQCLQRLVAAGEVEALQTMARHELEAGSTAAADALLDQLFETIASASAEPGEVGGEGDLIAMQSLIGRWVIAKRLNDVGRADRLWREIRLALCGPSTRLRAGIAEYFAQRDQVTEALQVYEAVLPLVWFGSSEETGIYDVARGYALLAQDHRVDQAAKWFDLAVCESIASGNYRAGAYVTLPLFVRRWSVEAEIARGDTTAVRRHLNRIAELDPLDIDLAERILPEMRAAGMAAVADETLAQILEQGIQYSDRFADDAMTANNLAWVAAVNGQRLQDALLLSRRAVYREPESAVYRDTLAEVLFRLGRYREALQVEESCLLDDPTQWHLHKQVEKYRASLDSDAP